MNYRIAQKFHESKISLFAKNNGVRESNIRDLLKRY